MTNPMLAELDVVVLKPCPFCGGNATIIEQEDEDGRFAAVICPMCGAGSRQHYFVGDDARPHVVGAWNKRTHHATLADTAKRLEALQLREAQLVDAMALMQKRLEAVERDAARIEWLQQEVDEIGAFLLHNGAGKGSGFTGLGLKNTGRTLRQAVDACMPQPIIDATQEGEG